MKIRAKVSQGIMEQLQGQGPTLSKQVGGDSEQGGREQKEEPATNLRH